MADDLEKRVDALEAEPEQLPDIDIRVVYWQTYFDEHGERHERRLPATYADDQTLWKPMGSGTRRMRVQYPLEDAGRGDGGVLDDKEVTD
jgi:hypothetical protein